MARRRARRKGGDRGTGGGVLATLPTPPHTWRTLRSSRSAAALEGGPAAKLTRRLEATLDGEYLNSRRASAQRRLPQRHDPKFRAGAYPSQEVGRDEQSAADLLATLL